MVAALYRRYRPETFAELIGQSQVTDPLRTALRTDRVNHAYLFSGPRGCGKTTSARILARCLNCAEGPTDTPCGVCPSCVELARDGSGSLDVVEIDAASHNGVDDARDLRERAVFAPARDRFKIFILDEAHMVTPQGFNALLKIVEEPPEHVKFIFATTEPEKVIGTIRSRTHHYPFRLVPPAQMLDYVGQLAAAEGVEVEAGVLPLVVRAGGGSVRDTLSLLDQLIAGSEPAAASADSASLSPDSTSSSSSAPATGATSHPPTTVTVDYERAVALLGYTHGALLDEVVDALGARDAGGAFGAVDRVIQTGQDPRRFVEDLLERLRDLIIVAATSGNAASVLRGIPQDQLDRMAKQASAYGTAELSRAADVVNAALTEMTGATSPRLHLELMVARVLVPASDETERGALARVERLERRIGVADPGAPTLATPAATTSSPTPAGASTPAAAAPERTSGDPTSSASTATTTPERAAGTPTSLAGRSGAAAAPTNASSASTPVSASEPVPSSSAAPASELPASAASSSPTSGSAASPPASGSAASSQPASSSPSSAPAETAVVAAPPIGPVTIQQVKDAWPEILEVVKESKLNAWMVVYTARPLELRDGKVLVLSFPSQKDVEELKKPASPGQGVGDLLKKAFVQVLGLEPAFIARVDASIGSPQNNAAPTAAPPTTTGWAAATPPADSPPTVSTAVPSPPTSSRAAATATSSPADRPITDEEPPPDEFPPTEVGWAVAAIPNSEPYEDEAPVAPTRVTSSRGNSSTPAKASKQPAAPSAAPATPAPASSTPAKPPMDKARYGESVVRELLGASFIEEQPVAPRVVPTPRDD